MDLADKFAVTVKETITSLIRKGKATQSWTADDGRVVTGWPVKYLSQPLETKGNPARGEWWRETWGHGYTILTKEGEFWEYGFSGTDEKDKGTVRTNSLRKTPDSYLVGARGRPFSEMTELLERLPYL